MKIRVKNFKKSVKKISVKEFNNHGVKKHSKYGVLLLVLLSC